MNTGLLQIQVMIKGLSSELAGNNKRTKTKAPKTILEVAAVQIIKTHLSQKEIEGLCLGGHLHLSAIE